jgi:hypothetical protein
MPSTTIFKMVVNQNGSWTLLGRVTSQDANGPLSPVPSEGNLILPTDLTSVLINAYDPTGPNPATPIFSVSPAPASVIQATLQTLGIWTLIVGGGNFEYNFGASIFTLPNHDYLVVVTFTTTGGTVSYGQSQVHTQRVGP